MSKRPRVSQDEPSFNQQAEQEAEDLVGFEQDVIGGSDRNTCGIKTRSSKWPNAFGAFRSTAPNALEMAKDLVNGLTPKTKFKLIDVDLDVTSNSGGFQLVFDHVYYNTRSATAIDSLRQHGINSSGVGVSYNEHSMQSVVLSTLRSVYKKCSEDTNFASTLIGGLSGDGTGDPSLPGLILTGYETHKHFTNSGNNTIVLELWDLLCTEDCSRSPVYCWAVDLQKVPNATMMPGLTLTPNTDVTKYQIGDPGLRPKKGRDTSFFDFWKCLRKTRYVIRAGQTITHSVKIPSTQLTHNQLYGWNLTVDATESHTYKANISVETMAIAIGELCIDSQIGSQRTVPSSCYITGRSEWNFNARSGLKARKEYCVITNPILGNPLDREALYPMIASTNELIISQSGAPARVQNANNDVI